MCVCGTKRAHPRYVRVGCPPTDLALPMTDPKPSVCVVLLEGEAGVGKSEVYTALRARGYEGLDEDFGEDVKGDLLHPQSFSRELLWMAAFFQRIRVQCAQHLKKAPGSPPTIIIADRSPASAVLFTKSERAVMRAAFDVAEHEMRELGIALYYVRLTCAEEPLLQRIQQRLAMPGNDWRVPLNEDDPAQMTRMRKLYDNASDMWNHTLRTDKDKGAVLESVERVIAELVV